MNNLQAAHQSGQSALHHADRHMMQFDEAAIHLRALLTENSPLLPYWFAFYKRLAGRLAPEQLTETGQQVFMLLNGAPLSPRQSLRLLSHLEALAHVQGAWHVRTLEGFQTLGLLPPETLRRLSLLFALVVLRDEICRVIQKQEVLAIESIVGKEGRLFAMRQAVTVLSDAMRRSALAEVFLPEKGLATALPPVGGQNTAIQSAAAERIHTTASGVLGFILREVPAELRDQVTLTLSTTWWIACPELPEELIVTTRSVLRTLLLKEVNPAWNVFL